VEVWIKGMEQRIRKFKGESGGRGGRGIWNSKGCKAYKEEIEKILLRGSWRIRKRGYEEKDKRGDKRGRKKDGRVGEKK